MTESDLLQIDESSRLRALELASFIVEAPAGAGKTELLTQRYLRLLATVQEPEEIIAITFTKKAVAEMRDRILASLSAATQAAVETLSPHKQITRQLALEALIRDAEYGWGLLGNPSRLRVTTIDSLSGSLARQMPFLSRFGAQPAVLETRQAKLCYEAAALRTLALLEEKGDAARTVEDALRYFDNDTARLQKLLVSMLERRDQWLGHIDAAGQDEGGAIAVLAASDLARASMAVDASMQAQLMATARYAAGNLIAAGGDSLIKQLADWMQPLNGDLNELDLWRGIAALLLTKEGALRSPKGFNKNLGLPAEKDAKDVKPFKEALAVCIDALTQIPGAAEALARIRLLPEPKLDAEEARIVGIFAQLLKLAAAQLWTVFQQQREVDFIEIAQRALSALGDETEPSDLQLKLDYRISHLLVDEFQDTSPAQIALLERLTTGWQEGDGRTLFVVGDPMQSIYRFRKADVGLFLQARQSGIGGIGLESLRLNRNNRSHPEVVDWINATFREVFPSADNPQAGAVKFASSVATKQSLEGTGVFIHPVLVDSENNEGDIDEARRVIDILRRARTQNPQGSIAILVRARHHLNTLVIEMRRSAPDLRYQAVEIEALEERQVVQDLLAITRALHHRGDRVNWLAALRAPWCGLTLPDLHALAADDHRSTVWQLMNSEARVVQLCADGRQRLRHLRVVFAEALAQQGRLRTRRWVEAVWRMLGGEACLHTAAQRADVEAYFRLIDKLDAGGGFTLDRLDTEIASLYAEPDPNAENPDSPAIQIMTVHKSKGLEFDTVILPGLHRALPGNDNSLLQWEEFVDDHGHQHLAIAPLKPGRSSFDKRDDKRPTAYDYLRSLEAERAKNEGNRLLYVAATRAIRALHLVAAATVEAKEEGDVLKSPKKGSPLIALWPAVETDFTDALSQWQKNTSHTELDDHSFADFVPKLMRLAAPAVPAYLYDTAVMPDATTLSIDADDSDTSDRSNRSPLADIGTLSHRILEFIAQDGIDLWSIERIRASQPAYKRWLQGRGHAMAALDAAATKVQETVCNAIESESGRWILAPRDNTGNELAVTGCRDGQVQSHVIDRTFIENNERWIIDYKSAGFDLDISESGMIARAEIYRPQLERYAALFFDEGLPIRLGIFFLAQSRLIELGTAKPDSGQARRQVVLR